MTYSVDIDLAAEWIAPEHLSLIACAFEVATRVPSNSDILEHTGVAVSLLLSNPFQVSVPKEKKGAIIKELNMKFSVSAHKDERVVRSVSLNLH